MERRRLDGLDGLRGIAAVGVALHHVFYHYADWPYASGPLSSLVDWLKQSGWTLVDLFFVLSGYVFAHVYLRDGALRSRRELADFWVARFARLYPLHLVMLCLVALFNGGDPANSLLAFAAHLMMLQAFVDPVAGTFNQASWSISIEMVCYVIFSLAALAGWRVLIWMSIVLVIVAAEALWLLGSPGGPWSGDVVWRGLLGFFLGQGLWQARARLARIPAWLLAVPLAAGLLWQVGPYSPLLPLTLLSWPAALLLSLRVRLFGARLLLWLGDRSYAIYLVNLPMITAVAVLLPAAKLTPAQTALVQVALCAAVLIASEASFRWVENPARRAIRRAWAGRRNVAEAPAPYEAGAPAA